MSLRPLAFAAVLFLPAILANAAESNQPAKPPKKSAPATSNAKPEDERTKRGKAMLALAEAEAGALDGEMRAYALLQAARAYATFDKSKATELLDQAYTASQVNHEETASKTRLVQQILVNMSQMAPERAESLLPYAPATIRAEVLNALLRQYLKKREFKRAKELVLQLSREGEFPYRAASQLMAALPRENSSDRQAIFGAALTSFRAADQSDRPRRGPMEAHGLPDMVVRFWRDLPSPLVKEAIDSVLEDAEKQSQASQRGRIMVATAKKSSNFNSIYEYQAQKLLPVLREIDESEAKRIADKLKQLNPSLDLEAGSPLPSESANQRGGEQPAEEMNFAMVGMGGPEVSAKASGRLLQMQRAMAVQSLAASKPQDALAQAGALEPEPRAMALEGIARVTAQRDSSVARKALDQLLDTAKSLDVEGQTRSLASAAEIYLRLQDKASAKRAIERGADAAEKLYQRDSGKDEANQALKAYWPSAGAWKRLIRIATRISEDFAASLVNDISDPEIKATERLALAGELLGAPPDATVTIVSQKGKPTQMMMEIRDDDGGEGLAQEVSQN